MVGNESCAHPFIIVFQLPILIPRGESEPSDPGKPFFLALLRLGEAPVDSSSQPLIYTTSQPDTLLEFKSMMCI